MPDSPADLLGRVPDPERGPRRPAARPELPPGRGGAPGGQDGSLRDLLAAVRQRRRTLLATVVLLPLAAYAVLGQMAPVYTASGALMYQASQYQSRELQSMIRAETVTEATMTTQAEVLQSLRIAEQVAMRGRLFLNPAFNPALRPPGPWRKLTQYVRAALDMEDAAPPPEPVYGPVLDPGFNATLQAVQASLHAAPVRFSHAVEVTFTAPDPNVAAAAVNNAMDAYIKGLYAEKYQKIEQGTAHLRARERELRRTVERLEDRIAAYHRDRGISRGVNAGTNTEQITRLSEDLVRARGEKAAADARMDAARGGKGASAQAAVAPSVVQLRAQQEQIAAQIEAQRTRLGPAHPEAQALSRQYADGQRALAAETARVMASLEAAQRAAEDRVAAVQADLKATEKAADQNARDLIPVNALERDRDAAGTQLQAVLTAIQQAANQTSIEFPEAHEITQALPPARPSWPNTKLIMAATVAASVFLGLALVYLLHCADDTLRGGEAIRLLTGLPCLALLPELRGRALGHLKVHEYVARRPLTAFAEQVRALRAALSLDPARPQVVAVTAPRPGDGKSVLALSLGRSAQLAGERVLAVECDLRRPSFQRRFGGKPHPGLLDALRGEAEWPDTVQRDPVTGMDYIAAGGIASRAAVGAGRSGTTDVLALFMSDEMRSLLAEAREAYDLILLDAPPVEAMTEARVAAALADATLVCVRWRSTQAPTLERALDVLREARARVIGTVLTRVDAREHLRSGGPDAGVYHRRYDTYYKG
jgi:Mrp family chromosome partitioning ATPase